MRKYLITNNKDNERYNKEFENETEARHWIINHLDTSKQWTILNQKKYESFEWFWDK